MNPTSLDFDHNSGSKTVTITSDIKPTYVLKEKWISLLLAEAGTNTYTLTVEVQPNTATLERSATISFIGNKKSATLTVNQGVPEVEFIVEKTAVEVNGVAGSAVVKVQSSVEPKVSCKESWCVPVMDALAADRTANLTIKAAYNMTTSDRTATVKVVSGTKEKEITVTQKAINVETASCDPVTPESFARQFVNGWNMGNQLDAHNNGSVGETVWGNDKCTQATFDAVKKAGFKSVRIPVTYLNSIGPAPLYEIKSDYLDRVAEVVGYAKKAGLNVIINIHHDGADSQYWLNIKDACKSTAKNQEVRAEIAQVWCQIAMKFKDEGDYLMFESFNEIHDGGWGWGSNGTNYDTYAPTLNGWNQLFVDVVRSTGGNNATRILGVPGPCANPNFTIASLVIPTDKTTSNRLAVAVHYYGYSNYQLTCKYSQWGHTADKDKADASDNEESTKWQVEQVKVKYQDAGIPAYFGETGCSTRDNAIEQAFHKYYLEYTWKCIHDYGMVPFLWDNGTKKNGAECHGYIDHGTGKFINSYVQECVEAMIRATTSTDPSYTLESVYDSAPSAN